MDEKTKRRTLRRLNIISGQIKGLQKIVMEKKYCVDIIHQSLAIKQALSSFEDLVLENHLAGHVIEQIKSGKEAKATKEILSVYKLSKRK